MWLCVILYISTYYRVHSKINYARSTKWLIVLNLETCFHIRSYVWDRFENTYVVYYYKVWFKTIWLLAAFIKSCKKNTASALLVGNHNSKMIRAFFLNIRDYIVIIWYSEKTPYNSFADPTLQNRPRVLSSLFELFLFFHPGFSMSRFSCKGKLPRYISWYVLFTKSVHM